MATGGTDTSIEGLGAGKMQLVGPLKLKDSSGNVVFQFPADVSDHVKIDAAGSSVDHAGKSVRVSFNTNTGTANDLVGMQVKPPQGAATAKNVIGAEISPRVNDTFALTSSGTLIGLHVDAYLKGTTGNIGGSVRGMQIEMITDDAGTRTVTGDVVGLRFRTAFSGTISGKMYAISIEKPEAQTNSKTYNGVLNLTSTLAGVWHDDPGTEPSTAAGYIKVYVNGNARYIQLYSGAPVD